MHFRRSAAALLAAAALFSGCKKVSQEPSPTELVIAAFNSAVVPGGAAAIPTPNDLALQAAPTLPASAQRALLQAFVSAGGFPGDQAVGITIPIKRLALDASTGAYVLSTPPAVDPTTLTTGAAPTFVVLRIDVDPPELQAVQVDAANCTTGQIALQKAPSRSGSRAWAPGRYAFALRGGAGGPRTTSGHVIDADQVIALVAPNKDLSNPNNQPPGGLPSALVARLEPVRAALWQPVDWNASGGLWTANAANPSGWGAFPAVAPYIPAEEVAVIGTFEIAAGASAVAGVPMPTVPVDAASGIAPLPLDLLRTASSGTNIAYNAAFGPAAQGLTTLDGFSTTAMLLAQVSFPVDAETVNGSTVHLYRLSGGTATRLKELKQELAIYRRSMGAAGEPAAAAYVAEPTALTTTAGGSVAAGVVCPPAVAGVRSGVCAGVIGLQPAVTAATGTALGTFYLPPLEEATDYAVVITTSVHDMLGRPLQKSTVGKILVDPGFDPVATSSVNGVSLLAGISNETATALRKMREQLVPVLGQLQVDTGATAADVVLAYTFRTQSGITATGPVNAVKLAAVPYGKPVGISPDPDAVSTFTPEEIAAAYGVDSTVLTAPGTIAELAEVKFQTVSWLLESQNSGAFDPYHATTETTTALVVVPQPALVTGACPPAASPYTAANCAPLVVFEHGLGSAKAEVLPIAGALAARGFVVVAADLPMHGERSYCSGSGPNAQAAADQMCCSAAMCGTAHTCAFKANLTSPVDRDANGVVQIGVCESAPGVRGRMLDRRVDDAAVTSPKGIARASANRFLSLNFFRVRDALRQDVIDVSARVKAFAPVGKSADAFATYLEQQHGIAVDHTQVYWIGHSGGVFAGAASLAVNPRITRAVAYAGGATAMDVFANEDSSYHATLITLLAGAGIAEGSAEYLKLLQVGKWILDPAEPANFARFVVPAATPLPSPFAGTPYAALWGTQPTREVLTQISACDGTVPNAQNQLLSGLLGRTDTGAILSGYAVQSLPFASTGTSHAQWFSQSTTGACPADAVGHSNPWDFSSPSLASQAQGFMGGFLASPASLVTPVVPAP